MDTVSLTVPSATFARLQAYAVPLVDTIDSVILRLCDHFDANPPPKPGYTRHVIDAPPPEAPKTYKTSRGVVLPAPMNLVGRYDGQTIEIELRTDGFWWDGKRYTDPSSVAVDVKKSLGASETTASTNGWKFWCVGNGDTLNAVPLDNLRQDWLNAEAKRMREWKRQQGGTGS